MVIENIMYFALGVLVAGLLALIVLPAVWKRAVRLTKRRIEAATPITMAEFRADKDQLRAEFALTTRRLEQQVEQLRKRLAEQLSEVNQKRTDLGLLEAERDKHLAIVTELEARAADLQVRVQDLERENTDLSQRLRMRDRELEARLAELQGLRAAGGADTAEPAAAAPEDAAAVPGDTLKLAEARIASAETRLNALLAETAVAADRDDQPDQPLADRLSREADVETLRRKVLGVESAIMTDWGTERADPAALRASFADIALGISRLVYAVDTEAKPDGESLFDRVQRFADDGEDLAAFDEDPGPTARRGAVSDRMTAIKELQGR